MQVVIQVFFVALCNNVNQHPVHTGNTMTKRKTLKLKNSKMCRSYNRYSSLPLSTKCNPSGRNIKSNNIYVCFSPVVLML